MEADAAVRPEQESLGRAGAVSTDDLLSGDPSPCVHVIQDIGPTRAVGVLRLADEPAFREIAPGRDPARARLGPLHGNHLALGVEPLAEVHAAEAL